MKALERIFSVAVLGIAAGFATAYVATSGLIDIEHLGEPRNVIDIDGQTVLLPRPEANPVRLAPIVVTDAVGSFAFESVGPDGPVLHDPCVAIHWQVSTVGMPVGAESVAKDAVASVAARTGLVFLYDGLTSDEATFEGPLLVHGAVWDYAPMVIGWANGDSLVDLNGDTTGIGGAHVSPGAYGTQEFLRSGTVILDTSDIPSVLDSDAYKAKTQAVIMHELGHVVGLDHVNVVTELMFPSAIGGLTWGSGDIAGLALAGAGPCEGQ